MSLFQNSVLNKYLKGLETEKVKEAYDKFTRHFHNPEIQENIRNSKEEQYQGEFLIDLFVNVLGYIKNPAPEFNLTTELKNIKDSKKTDGAILNGETALAVIELKGTNTTDLSKVETQAFGYKNNQPGCNYVITSNFEKLRFYIDNAVDFEEFNLFQLTKEKFDILWLCLSADYLLKNTPKKIKDESLTQEENVTKKLYNDYSDFRNEIFDSIQKENPEYDKLTLFKKTQKLLDRFLFIFFAEDRLLLPPNSIRAIVNQWKDLRDKYDEYVPLYDRFKKYFGYMNTGHKGQQHDIFAYNGGLFAPDEILDNIKINDDILSKHTVNLSNYDFESEVSVNILGHIFEHSLNEIETIQSEIEGIKTDQSKTPPDRRAGKRKKDGVFYTPKYITKYIVENTIGKLCLEKKTELEIQETEFEKDRKGRQKTTLKKLTQKLDDYRKWLLQLTICDPACGSGAFLNQALEFLIAEHRYIDELQAKLFGVPMILSEVENSILENNLYGVDINEESVEIAKLSLWLRTAQKGRKLTTLNNNIKCGNSLINDPEIAGEKAFNWHTEFPDIFRKKDKKAWHITTATHNSRTSQRMWDLKIEPGEAVWLDEEKEITVTRAILEIVMEDNLNVLAYNICGDHMHIMLVCEEEELNDIVAKIKGRSSFVLNRGVNPSGQKAAPKYADGTRIPTWTRKFNTSFITSDEKFENTIAYIQNNRNKHQLPMNKGLQPLVNEMTCSREHAFRTEYNGGFDVIIGNPPYVHLEKIKETSIALKNANYETYHSQGDIYCVFVEKGIDLLKHNGLISYIMPNKWLQAGYGKPLREYFLKYKMFELIDFGDIQIFDGATTYPCIFTSQKAEPQNEISISVLKESNSMDFKFNVLETAEKFETNSFSGETWVISSQKEQAFLEKLKTKFVTLSDFIGGQSYRGVLTGLTEAFLIDEQTKQTIVKNHPEAAEIIKPFLQGRDLSKYNTIVPNSYLILLEKGITKQNITEETEAENWLPTNYPSVFDWLKPFEERGKKRTDKGDYWWELRACDYYQKFSEPKIMYQAFQVKPCFIFDEQGLFSNNSIWFIPTKNKALLGVLNSKMGWWLITKYCTQIQNGYQLIWKYFGQIPVPKLDSTDLNELVEKMLVLTQNQQSITNAFIRYLNSQFTIEKLSRKLENWFELEFSEFIKELSNAIKKSGAEKLSKSDEMEWMELFETKKSEVQTLKSEINKTDKEIDKLVYELYGLTETEIKIVEEATA